MKQLIPTFIDQKCLDPVMHDEFIIAAEQRRAYGYNEVYARGRICKSSGFDCCQG